jgi:hypothetical protein
LWVVWFYLKNILEIFFKYNQTTHKKSKTYQYGTRQDLRPLYILIYLSIGLHDI